MYTLSDFDFNLPEALIAQYALPERSASRLLHVGPPAPGSTSPHLTDHHFADLVSFLRPGDLLVFNDTKVLKARFFGTKASGGHVEVLVERLIEDPPGTRPVGAGGTTALAQIRASKSPRAGTTLRLADAFDVIVGERVGPFYTLTFPGPCLDLIEQYGRLPLPPYIQHTPDASDETRYQTVYAAHPGAVAAPTAGLHFDEALLAALDAAGIQRGTLTLHVGAGTFQPVRTENIADHVMHSESYEIPAALADAISTTRAAGGRVIAVGTTSMRALESAARDQATATGASDLGTPANVAVDDRSSTAPQLRAHRAETDIFITPGYPFRIVDCLITNFHLPKSTLMMLVSAFAGMAPIRAAYRHAIAAQYRFFSYGDAMFLIRTPEAPSDAQV
ncbi:S-adenosylmethionine:tRNA ribosyltransferase-isomerase [Robbsia andropogonis]|uniref:tRNA preQ1(34) S-adenosylmethionine ribosyltransferase-isomerase QueA n=1 Tax=Robbsia andropogonis TaxID=28092 RepID=UPI003D195AB1